MLSKSSVLSVLRHSAGPVSDVVVKEKEVYMTMALADCGESATLKVREETARSLRRLGAEGVHIRFKPLAEREESSGVSKPPAATVKPEGHSFGPDTVFLSVVSGKGGVGKSTVAANLARALAAEGKRVGLLDADIYGYSVPVIMGIRERPALEDGMVVPVPAFGVKVASIGFFSDDNAPVVWRGPQLGKMLRTLFTLVKWGELDYMVIDLPPGTGDIALDLQTIVPGGKELIVTTPHINACHVAVRAGELARRSNREIVGVIENMAYMTINGAEVPIYGTGGGDRLAAELSTRLLARIPLEAPAEEKPELYAAGTCLFHESSPPGRLFAELARLLIAMDAAAPVF